MLQCPSIHVIPCHNTSSFSFTLLHPIFSSFTISVSLPIFNSLPPLPPLLFVQINHSFIPLSSYHKYILLPSLSTPFSPLHLPLPLSLSLSLPLSLSLSLPLSPSPSLSLSPLSTPLRLRIFCFSLCRCMPRDRSKLPPCVCGVCVGKGRGESV